MENKEIRFGILCNGEHLQSWQMEAIRELLQVPGTRCCLLIMNNNPPVRRRLSSKLDRTLLYRQFERRMLRPASRRMIPVSNALGHVPVMHCATQRSGKHGETFSEQQVQEIREMQLDFMIRFGFNILKGDILAAARWGIWSYHHGDPGAFRGGPPGYWEIMKNKPVTGAVLQRLTPQLDQGIMLHRGFFATRFHSYHDQVENLLTQTSSWPRIALLGILNGSLDPGTGIAVLEKPGPLYKAPSNLTHIVFTLRLLRYRIAFYWSKYFLLEKWNIGCATLDTATLIKTKSIGKVHWFPHQTPFSYAADPFAISSEKTEIFFEHYSYSKSRGKICATTFDPAAGSFSEPTTLLEGPTHYSYPFAFTADDTTYLLPENFQGGKLVLYRIEEAGPVKDAILLKDEKIIDPTLLHHGGLYWLFCTKKEGANESLHLYYSDQLKAGWRAHPLNPVKTDVRSARPAGPFFTIGADLYRPSMNNTQTYGGSLVINRIVELSPQSFREEPVNEIHPSHEWLHNKGLHTLCISNGKAVIDAKRYCFSLYKLLKIFQS